MRSRLIKKVRGSSLFAGTAVYLVSNILNSVIPFALLPVLTRYLGPEEYGEVAMFNTLLGALMALIGLSMHGAAGRKFYDGDMDKQELAAFIGSCVQILIFTSLTTLLIMSIFASAFSQWLGIGKEWLLLAVVMTAGRVIIQLRVGQWQIRKRARQVGTFEVSRSVVNISFSLVLVTVFLMGAEGRMASQVVTAWCFAILALMYLAKDGLIRIGVFRLDFIKEILRFGIPLVPHVAGIFLLASVDRFVINDLLGLASAGVYMVAVQFSMAASLVFDAINKAYVPWLYERLSHNDPRQMKEIVRFTYLWYLVILAGAGLAFLIGPDIVVWVAGSGYEEAGDVVGWLVLGQVFGGMYLMVTNYIFYSKKTGQLSLVTIFSGMTNVALLYAFIGAFGIQGAAYSFCIAMGMRFLLTWWVAQQRHPMPWFHFYK